MHPEQGEPDTLVANAAAASAAYPHRQSPGDFARQIIYRTRLFLNGARDPIPPR